MAAHGARSFDFRRSSDHTRGPGQESRNSKSIRFGYSQRLAEKGSNSVQPWRYTYFGSEVSRERQLRVLRNHFGTFEYVVGV